MRVRRAYTVTYPVPAHGLLAFSLLPSDYVHVVINGSSPTRSYFGLLVIYNLEMRLRLTILGRIHCDL